MGGKDSKLEPGFPGVRRSKGRMVDELLKLAHDVRFVVLPQFK
jgi:hypothetical protein